MSTDESIVERAPTEAEKHSAMRRAEEAERARDVAERRAGDAEQECQLLRDRIDEVGHRLGRFQHGGAQRILDAEQRLRAELQKELAATRRRVAALERAHDTAMSSLGVDVRSAGGGLGGVDSEPQ